MINEPDLLPVSENRSHTGFKSMIFDKMVGGPKF
ncbi:hypothetical protein Enr17x_08920 [Gimesia fumaroli]|uniref:Uncharacterized protein n=1 Tax=Gimesia fumaroli TaxID=2527976 RepID=A0A518I722_9PLAN|nr:hypothetical protein Enr17x_08920 [Gimesia fumaroli]